MSQRILIMGLPGAGKTTLAGALKKYLEEHGEIRDDGFCYNKKRLWRK